MVSHTSVLPGGVPSGVDWRNYDFPKGSPLGLRAIGSESSARFGRQVPKNHAADDELARDRPELTAISTHVRVVRVDDHIAVGFEARDALDREGQLPVGFLQDDQVACFRPRPLEHDQSVARLKRGPHTRVFDHEPAQRQQSAHPLGVDWTTLPRPVRWAHRSGT
jgi:hypothetical protein